MQGISLRKEEEAVISTTKCVCIGKRWHVKNSNTELGYDSKVETSPTKHGDGTMYSVFIRRNMT